jgi:MoxR-like ATPase
LANASDLWVLRYVWDREEQIAPLAALVAGLLEAVPDESESPHPLAARPDRPDSEALAKQLDDAERILASGTLTLIELVRLREQVTNVSDRAEWVTDTVGRDHLLTRAGGLLEKIGE